MYEELKKVGQDGYFLYLHYRHGLYPSFFYYTICQHAHSEGPVADGAFGGSIPVCGKITQEGTGTGMCDRDFR